MFSYKIQLRYPDYDTQFLVNHSAICTYIESAYISFFIDFLKCNWNYAALPILLKKSITEFIHPIGIQSVPVCKIFVKEIRSKGVTLSISIIDENISNLVYVTAERILIHVDLKTLEPVEFATLTFNNMKLI